MPKELDRGSSKLALDKFDRHSSKGCILKVYLEYPKELHEKHNNYSFAPDKLEIKKEMLSECQ